MSRPYVNQARIRNWLELRFFLRLHMFLILGGTFLAGIVATKLLFELGVDTMSLRYAIAVVLAYFVFLFLIRLWLWYVGLQAKPDPADSLDGLDGLDAVGDSVDFCADAISSLRPLGEPVFVAGDGSFGGSGATGSWGDAILADATPSSGSGGSIDAPGCGLDLDEGLILVLLAVVLIALLGASIYVIWAAPAILAEAAFEAALAVALARSAKRVDRPGWVGRVWRATFWPFLGILVLTVTLGWLAQRECPEARRLVDAIDCARR